MPEQLTRDYLQSLALDPYEVQRKRNDFIDKELHSALYQIVQYAKARRTNYRIVTTSRLFTPDVVWGLLNALRTHLPDCTIREDALGNGIVIDWS